MESAEKRKLQLEQKHPILYRLGLNIVAVQRDIESEQRYKM
jgi:hypothetical protein